MWELLIENFLVFKTIPTQLFSNLIISGFKFMFEFEYKSIKSDINLVLPSLPKIIFCNTFCLNVNFEVFLYFQIFYMFNL